MGEPQVPQNIRTTPGDERYSFGASPTQRQAVSRIDNVEVIGAEQARRQLSQWQCEASMTPSGSKAKRTAPQRQRPWVRVMEIPRRSVSGCSLVGVARAGQ
jgi:hypothetical protein